MPQAYNIRKQVFFFFIIRLLVSESFDSAHTHFCKFYRLYIYIFTSFLSMLITIAII